MTLMSILLVSYVIIVIAGYCGIFAAILEKDLVGFVKDTTGLNASKYTNGSMLILALILVPLWPLLLLRPIFNWLKRPCQ